MALFEANVQQIVLNAALAATTANETESELHVCFGCES